MSEGNPLRITHAEYDGFPLAADDPHREGHALVAALLTEILARGQGWRALAGGAQRKPVERILEAEPALQVSTIHAALDWLHWRLTQSGIDRPLGEEDVRILSAIGQLIAEVLERTPALGEADLLRILDHPAAAGDAPLTQIGRFHYMWFRMDALLQRLERWHAEQGFSAAVRARATALCSAILSRGYVEAETKRLVEQLRERLHDGKTPLVDPEEPWAAALVEEFAALEPDVAASWLPLLQHCLAADGSKPSTKWLAQARRLVEPIGWPAFRERSARWLEAAAANTAHPVSARNGNLLRALVWCWGSDGDPTAARLIADVGIGMARKIPKLGPRSTKVLNACITTIGQLQGLEALSQLTRLRSKVKPLPAQKLIATTLAAAAERAALSVDDLEELAVPTFGMTELGCRREDCGEMTAELRITGTDTVELRWLRADGKAQKSVPADVQREHKEELAELKKAMKEMTQMLPAQRDRLERSLLAERVLPVSAWRPRYLDHPLVGPLARRLVWHFDDGHRSALGAWHDGALVDVSDRALDWVGDDAQVRLWHPIGFDVDTVRAWRDWLDRHEVVQPFKQAHREVYVLTDAELATATHSNRFAAHIVKQHQLHALCQARGWRSSLLGGFDRSDTPTLQLPRHGLTVEFFVEPCLGGDDTMSASGIALYVSTDQVRFLDRHGVAVPIHEVPAMVFSEVMRDVDLFVGVASVGADPAWAPAGDRPGWADYWTRYAFGDLSASAQTRRDVLERLVPRLKIADRCTLESRFLVVRGDLRTYKIHLGSGNILMEPNDQYLCIVPDRGAGARQNGVRLPFEGDSTMSVILSKAFLLAADTKITDETILRQIHR